MYSFRQSLTCQDWFTYADINLESCLLTLVLDLLADPSLQAIANGEVLIGFEMSGVEYTDDLLRQLILYTTLQCPFH